MPKKVGQEMPRFVLPKWWLPGERERYLDCMERHDCLDAHKSLERNKLFEKFQCDVQRTHTHLIGPKRMVINDRGWVLAML